MPNWCTSRLYFQKSDRIKTPEDLRAVLDNFGFRKDYAEAMHVIRRAFLLVHSGLVRVRPELYGRAPLIWMIEPRRSINTAVKPPRGCLIDLDAPVNPVVSDLIALINTPKANQETLKQIVQLGAMAELHKYTPPEDEDDYCWSHVCAIWDLVWRDWETTLVPKGMVEAFMVDKPYTEPKNDILGCFGHELHEYVPFSLLAQLNGFNGTLDPKGLNGYDQNTHLYGTKWTNVGMRVGLKDDRIYVDFATAWAPPSEIYNDALSLKHPEFDEAYYAEMGVGFCGSIIALEPGVTLSKTADLKIEYTDEECEEIKSISPAWIEGNVSDYGG